MKPKWLEIAESQQGVHEVRGGENPQIVAYHQTTTLKATDDETPWCSSFVNWAITQAGVKGTNSARARSWTNWGIPSDPVPGAITIIKQRTVGKDKATGSASGYHVAFFVDKSETHIRLLGGNQGDSVKVSAFPLSRYQIIDYRWPAPELPEAA